MKKYSSYKSYPRPHLTHEQLSNLHIAKQITTLQNKKKTDTELNNHLKYNVTSPKNIKSTNKDKEAHQPISFKPSKTKPKPQLYKHPNLSKAQSEKNLTPTDPPAFIRQNSNLTLTNLNNPYRASKSPKNSFSMNSPKFQSSNSYANLKQKIDDIAGKLRQIKKDYELTKIESKKKNKTTLYSVPQVGRTSFVASSLEKENLKNYYNYIDKQGQKTGLTIERQQEPKKRKNNNEVRDFKITKEYTQEVVQARKINTARLRQDKNKSILAISHLEKQKIQAGQIGLRDSSPSRIQFTQKLSEYVTAYNPALVTSKRLNQCTSETNILKSKHKNESQYYISSILKAFQSKISNSFQQLCRNHLISSLDILAFIKDGNLIQQALSRSCRILKMPSMKVNRKITVVFDLDETLIHCNENTKVPCDIILPIKFPDAATIRAGVNIRPYAEQCLRELSKHFQVMVFTASHQFYANTIIDHLDPNNEYISHRMFRDSCHKTQPGFYVKDLRVIDRDLKNVLLVDNAAYSYAFQPENGIPIIPFYDNKADLQLKQLVKYLKAFINEPDARQKNSQLMKIKHYPNYKNPKQLINQLYL